MTYLEITFKKEKNDMIPSKKQQTISSKYRNKNLAILSLFKKLPPPIK
jgi:hypothetical protein